MYKLKMSFEGLFAFVCSPSGNEKEASEITVLMIDGRNPGKFESVRNPDHPDTKHDDKHFLVHVPSLQIPIDSLIGAEMEDKRNEYKFQHTSKTFISEEETLEEAVWPLDRDQLSLDGQTSIFNTVHLADSFLNSIPRMKELYPPDGLTIYNDFIDPTKFPDDLVGRISFNKCTVAGEEKITKHQFVFADSVTAPDPRTAKTFYRKVAIELMYPSDTITLSSIVGASNTKRTDIRIKLDEDHTVEIKVRNMPPSHRNSDFDLAVVGDPDFDFGLVYKVVQANNRPNYLKLPQKTGTASFDKQMCGSATFGI